MKTFNCNSHKILSPWQLMTEKYLNMNIEIIHFRHTKLLLKKCIIKIIMTLTLMAIFELPIYFVVWVRICRKSVKHECHPVLIYTTWCCPKLQSNGKNVSLKMQLQEFRPLKLSKGSPLFTVRRRSSRTSKPACYSKLPIKFSWNHWICIQIPLHNY